MFAKFMNKMRSLHQEEVIEELTITDVSQSINKTLPEVSNALITLKWVEKSGTWWIPTEEGKRNGAVERYNAKTKKKYVNWNPSVLTNSTFLKQIGLVEDKSIEPLQENDQPELKRTSYKEKVEKGKTYEKFIAEHFRQQGFTIAEHGIDNGVKDNGIDIIAKKGKDIFFIQCKNWSASGKYKIRDKEIKIARTDARDYMTKHPMYSLGGYNMKLLYVMSENVLHGSGYHYILANSEIVEFRIIPMMEKI